MTYWFKPFTHWHQIDETVYNLLKQAGYADQLKVEAGPLKTYTVIVGRPDYVSDNQLSDTYMTSLQAENAEQAGELACAECARVDSKDMYDDESEYDPSDYVVVCTLLGEHSDFNGRTDV